MKKDFISMIDAKDEILILLDMAASMKEWQRTGQEHGRLHGKCVGLIFEKPSTRTRVSFEVAVAQLGGTPIFLDAKTTQLGRGESISDTAKVLSRYVDALVYRAFTHEAMEELARHATVPVINALDNLEHPCQTLADLLTIRERKGGRWDRISVAWIGDGNNVCNSLLLGTAMVGAHFVAACPPEFRPNARLLEYAEHICKESGGTVRIVEQPKEAAMEADVLTTDVWVSMGDEKEKEERERAFAGYQVDERLMGSAKESAIFLHCLPAHRGSEVTAAVIDGPQSAVWDQAENRLHVQKALLARLIG